MTADDTLPRADGPMPHPDGDAELRALVALRDAAVALLELEADPQRPDDDLVPARCAAAELYERYVATWGPLNRGVLHEGPEDPQTGLPAPSWRRPDLGGFRAHPDYLTVMALEQYDQETGAAAPAAILRRRVNGRPRPVSRVANAHEALLVTLGETGGRVDLARIADLLGLPGTRAAEAALGELAFRDPERGGECVSAREYLSGDVRARRDAARHAAARDPRYHRNVAALDEVVPPELGPHDIAVSLGAPWIAAEDVEDFVHEVLGGRVKVWHLPSAASWKIVPLGKIPPGAFAEYGTPRLSAYDLLSAGLNGRAPIVWDTAWFGGRRRRVRNAEQSMAAQERLTDLQDRFRVWLWEDAYRTERLCAEYNRRFNAHLEQPYDGSQLTFPGLADGIELWPWQRDIVARIVATPATMCGHAVGAGKTRSMVCAAMTARRLGLATKPLIAVPSHLVEQVAREARQAYPFGRFVVAGEEAGGRPALAARCATGDWDAVIVSHGTFSALPVDPAGEVAWLTERLDDLDRQLQAGKAGRFGRGELRRRSTALQARIDRLGAPGAARPSVVFESLGVDLLLIDEAHYFKRLPVASRREGLSFGASQRAADLMLKARTVRARRGRLPSLALFTGTPWSNTVAETFVWQSFLQPDVLAEAGIDTFDAWSAVFVDYETTVEVTPDGSGFRTSTRPSRIRNVPELRTMFGRCADILPAAALALDRPDHVEQTVVTAPGPLQHAYVLSLAARADKIHREGMRALRGEDNMLVLCTDGRRAALDPRLVGVAEDSPKLAALADRVARLHRDGADVRYEGSEVPGVLQLIFCDQGTPGRDGLQTYGRIRLALHHRGVPAERVRWVHEARTDAERAALFAQCREGAVSVLIGSTDKLGVGTNVQQRLRAVHHADAPWRPSDIEQREGRALRPGNLNPVVDVVRYVTEGTFDAYMWQTLQRKAGFIAQLYRGDSGVREIDDVGDVVLSYAEVKALATGNPLLLEQARAAATVHRLRVVRAVDAQVVTAARDTITQAESELAGHIRHETMLRAAGDRLAWFASRPATGATDDDAATAADLLHERLHAPDPAAGPEPVRAPWRGLGIELLPVGGWAGPAASVELRITLAHRRVDVIELPALRLRRSASGARRAVLDAVHRWAGELEDSIDRVAGAAATAEETIAAAQRIVRSHRFGRADELAAAQARLDDISTALESSVRHD